MRSRFEQHPADGPFVISQYLELLYVGKVTPDFLNAVRRSRF